MTFPAIAAMSTVLASSASAAYCRYRIRSYDDSSCNGMVHHDAQLSSRDCFDTKGERYIWVDSLNDTNYCNNGNWIREYANVLHLGSCSNNNRGQENIAIGSCHKLQYHDVNQIPTDSIRINYA